MEHYGWCVGALWSIMGGVWEHYGALWVVCGSIMEHYGWCVGALWVVCGSIRERNYRLKKKNYLSGPIPISVTKKNKKTPCKQTL